MALFAFSPVFDLDLVTDFFHAEYGLGEIFGHSFSLTTIHMTAQRDFSVLDVHFDITGVDHRMASQLLVDVFLNPMIRTFERTGPSAGMLTLHPTALAPVFTAALIPPGRGPFALIRSTLIPIALIVSAAFLIRVPVSTRSLIPVAAIPVPATVAGFHFVLTFTPVGVTATLPPVTGPSATASALPARMLAFPAAIFLPVSALRSGLPIRFTPFIAPALTAALPHVAVSTAAPAHVLTAVLAHLVIAATTVFLVATPISTFLAALTAVIVFTAAGGPAVLPLSVLFLTAPIFAVVALVLSGHLFISWVEFLNQSRSCILCSEHVDENLEGDGSLRGNAKFHW